MLHLGLGAPGSPVPASVARLVIPVAVSHRRRSVGVAGEGRQDWRWGVTARSGGKSIDEAIRLIENLAPGGVPVPIRTPLVDDECVWFLRAVADKVVRFTTCSPDCFRFKKWGTAGPDHFTTPHGKP